MNDSDFRKGINILMETFNPKAFTSAKTEAIFKKVKGLSGGEWAEIVERIVNECTSSPTPNQIGELARPYYNARRERDLEARKQNLSSGADCKACGLTGMISAFSKENPQAQAYAFRCPNCQSADMLGLSKQIPLWDDASHGERFERQLMAPQGIQVTPEKAAANRQKIADLLKPFSEPPTPEAPSDEWVPF